MPIVKLDATASTNDFLSELAASQPLENYFCVSAEQQTNGRGQRGASWDSQPGKNLMISVFVKSVFVNAGSLFVLNAAVAEAVADTVAAFGAPDVKIKWPNDILSGSRKISGILIENSLKPGSRASSIVGIGLNVNQTDFGPLPRASSMALVCGREFDRDAILEKLLQNIRLLTENAEANADEIWARYHERLFKKDVPAAFESDGTRFMGIIEGVDRDGRLRLRHEDDSIRRYGIRELSMLY